MALGLVILLIVGVFATVRIIDACRPPLFKDGKINLTIAKDITYITGPVLPDGTVDYEAYFLKRYQRLVPPEKNAAHYLVRAIGPQLFKYWPEKKKKRYLDALGITSLPADGDYLLAFTDYLENKFKEENLNEADIDNIVLEKSKAFRSVHYYWKKEHYPTAWEWLKSMEKPLKLFEKASTCKTYYSPHFITYNREKRGFTDDAFTLYLLIQVIKAKATFVEESIKPRTVADNYMKLLRLIRLKLKGPSSDEHYLNMLSWERDLLSGLRHLAVHGGFSLKALLALRQNLLSMKPSYNLVDCLNTSRLFYLPRLMDKARMALNGETTEVFACFNISRLPEWDTLLQGANNLYDRYVATVGYENRPEKQKQMIKLYQAACQTERFIHSRPLLSRFFGQSFGFFSTHRDVSEYIVNLCNNPANIFWIFDNNQNVLANFDLTLMALTLAAYKRENGIYPPKLTDLIPGFVNAIPNDRTTGKLLQYTQQKKGESYLLKVEYLSLMKPTTFADVLHPRMPSTLHRRSIFYTPEKGR